MRDNIHMIVHATVGSFEWKVRHLRDAMRWLFTHACMRVSNVLDHVHHCDVAMHTI